ncbi:MAG: D-tyrosyl-tRNA(Tyr) deacylase, partial [Chlorobi bacterium]|nr:D-tyrosyl-tRNA(Tyr) deacylase [Chlorobiota bacterium]
MKALIQRVSKARVLVEQETVGHISRGLLILLGVGVNDTEEDAEYLARRCANLRVFNDDQGKMNLSVLDVKGQALVVSQFTLHADTRKGNRPSYTRAAEPGKAEHLYELFARFLRDELGSENVSTGIFGAMMDVELVNQGPVTVL